MNYDLSHHLRSKTGKSLFYVFVMTTKVKDFDHQHCLFKDFRYSKSAKICNRLQSSFVYDLSFLNEVLKSVLFFFSSKHIFAILFFNQNIMIIQTNYYTFSCNFLDLQIHMKLTAKLLWEFWLVQREYNQMASKQIQSIFQTRLPW